MVHTREGGAVHALRAAIEAASGEYLVVLDPRRSYPPSALAEVVDRLDRSEADLAIAVPEREPNRTWWSRLTRRCLGLAGEATLGTSDLFSGLMAIRRSHLSEVPTVHKARGSRLALDLLAWPCPEHADVPVATLPDDRLHLGRVGLNDIRQLKRVLDQRFGTFSRLVQFCMVGASGMVVDLTFYAIFQALFAGFAPASAAHEGHQVSWNLAAARALAIFIALVWNFTLNRRFTFNDSRSGSIPRQFLTYALGNALGIAVSMSLSLLLPMYVGFFARHKLAAAVVGIVVATGISFSMSRWVVFIRRVDGLPAGPHALLPVEKSLQETAVVSQPAGAWACSGASGKRLPPFLGRTDGQQGITADAATSAIAGTMGARIRRSVQ
jgi:dolichol-phosphate mannosyltransferase